MTHNHPNHPAALLTRTPEPPLRRKPISAELQLDFASRSVCYKYEQGAKLPMTFKKESTLHYCTEYTSRTNETRSAPEQLRRLRAILEVLDVVQCVAPALEVKS